jgi:phosphomethylpyrimidine synthase
MYLKSLSEGVISRYFPEVLSILKKYNVLLSVGSVFRPANVVDALDEVHRAEIDLQGVYISEAKRQGVQVIMEGVGHMTLDKIGEYTHIIKSRYGIPMVPLGPITSDAAVGQDHITNAIGGAYMAFIGGADMINSVTREEHTGGVPTLDSVIEGLKAARIAAHSVNITRFPLLDGLDKTTAQKRARNHTCVIEGGLFTESSKMRFSMGCTRCGKECPLLINYILDDHNKKYC